MYNYASFMMIFIVTNCFLGPMLFYKYDKIISANIYVRLIHGVGCIDYLIPVLNKYPITILDFEDTPMPEEVSLIFDRSIAYFTWDCIALIIANEDEKYLFIVHHILSLLGIFFAWYYGINWYLICVGLFVGEITNPLTQISTFYALIDKKDLLIEQIYFYSMLIVRGFILPMFTLLYMFEVYTHYDKILHQSSIYQLSLIVNYCIMILITHSSVLWIHKKYLLIYNIDDKKMS